MARRKKRAKGFNPAPFIVAALAIAAVVAWAVVPRSHRRAIHTVTQITAAPAVPEPSASSGQTVPAASPSPRETPSPSPSASPSAPPGGARLAIIIDDCGQWFSTEKALIELPIPLTMSVMPHVRYTAETAQLASAAGKGVMLHLPMEPLSHKNSGEGEIETQMTDAQIVAQTRDDLAQVPLAAGVNNHEGSAASADARVMRDVIGVIKEHDLFFVDSRTNKATVAAQSAADAGVRNASRDVFLDNLADTAATKAMLEQAADIALRKGSAIAIGHPKATTLEAIREVYPELQARGVTFVLASDLVR